MLKKNPLPREGAAILVCNHTASLDPMILQAVTSNRIIVWMMAKEYMNVRGLGWFFRTLGIILVERSGKDSGPLRSALRELKKGRVLGVFPEGRITKNHELLPFQTGVAMMAIKADVPVYPAYIEGSQRGKDMVEACAMPQQVTVTFGPAVQFNRDSTTRENLEAATAAIKSAIEKLRDEYQAMTKACG